MKAAPTIEPLTIDEWDRRFNVATGRAIELSGGLTIAAIGKVLIASDTIDRFLKVRGE